MSEHERVILSSQFHCIQAVENVELLAYQLPSLRSLWLQEYSRVDLLIYNLVSIVVVSIC